MWECVDIITTEGIGISVWSKSLPPCEVNDGWIDIAYPGPIPSIQDAIGYARKMLGHFQVKSIG